MTDPQALITGATGRLGQILRLCWATRPPEGLRPVWSGRSASAPGLVSWDILNGPAPELGKGSVILHLAGVLRGDAASLAANRDMALKVCALASARGTRHVFLASSAAVYGPGSAPHDETEPPDPRSDYGRAKVQMEQAALDWRPAKGAHVPAVTCLRIGNVLGADALFGPAWTGEVMQLDPVGGSAGLGPVRSYIGPRALASVLASLLAAAAKGRPVPRVLNLAAPAPVAMSDLLVAAGRPFRFGAATFRTIPKVSLCTDRLSRIVPPCDPDARALVADWASLLGPSP